MKIGIIDDKKDELEKAIEIVEKKGHEAIVIYMGPGHEKPLGPLLRQLDDVDCIITDLMFNPLPNTPYYDSNIPPAGLLVVIYGLGRNKGVVVCTNTDEVGGHHEKALGWIFDGSFAFFELTSLPTLPIAWEESKDWEEAVKEAERLYKKITKET